MHSTCVTFCACKMHGIIIRIYVRTAASTVLSAKSVGEGLRAQRVPSLFFLDVQHSVRTIQVHIVWIMYDSILLYIMYPHVH